jgi:dihydrodipicolinate synthase/N-acetylneuraminate lyase
MARFEGIIPAVTTPFTADDQVDVPALKASGHRHDGRGRQPHA